VRWHSDSWATTYAGRGFLVDRSAADVALLLLLLWDRQTDGQTDRRQTDAFTLSAIDQFDMTDRLTPSVTDRLLIVDSILLQQPFLCCSSCVQSIMGFFYVADVNIILSVD